MLHDHFRRSPERPEQLEFVLGAHDGLRLLCRPEVECFLKALSHLQRSQHEPSITVEPTHSCPLPFGLRIDDGASCYLSANEAESVPVRPQRTRRTERAAPLLEHPVEENVHHFDRQTREGLDGIVSDKLAESKRK